MTLWILTATHHDTDTYLGRHVWTEVLGAYTDLGLAKHAAGEYLGKPIPSWEAGMVMPVDEFCQYNDEQADIYLIIEAFGIDALPRKLNAVESDTP